MGGKGTEPCFPLQLLTWASELTASTIFPPSAVLLGWLFMIFDCAIGIFAFTGFAIRRVNSYSFTELFCSLLKFFSRSYCCGDSPLSCPSRCGEMPSFWMLLLALVTLFAVGNVFYALGVCEKPTPPICMLWLTGWAEDVDSVFFYWVEFERCCLNPVWFIEF